MSSLIPKLASLLDAWSDTGRALLTETPSEIVANNLSAADADEVSKLCSQLGWAIVIEDGAQNETPREHLSDDFAPFRIVMSKPGDVAGPDRLVTNTALASLLDEEEVPSVLRLVQCLHPFETRSIRIAPFDDAVATYAAMPSGAPRRVVREIDTRRQVTQEIGRWLLRQTDKMPLADPAFLAWAGLAEPKVMHAMANEVEPGTLVFRGPPLVRLMLEHQPNAGWDPERFLALQDAGNWVYEEPRELDMRHGLYAAEIARAAGSDRDARSMFKRVARAALESARIAYGLSISQVSRDTLRALADLRKAVSDESSKLADSTRTMAGAVATALFAGLGLILTRVTASTPKPAVIVLTVVLALYVGSVIWSGAKFIGIQREIRRQWRTKLYAFLSQSEYDDMVGRPAAQAEAGFRLAAILGGTLTALMVAFVIGFIWLEGSQMGKSDQQNRPVAEWPSSTPSTPATSASSQRPSGSVPAAEGQGHPAPVAPQAAPPPTMPATPSQRSDHSPGHVKPAVLGG
jgi:hypothetical protein